MYSFHFAEAMMFLPSLPWTKTSQALLGTFTSYTLFACLFMCVQGGQDLLSNLNINEELNIRRSDFARDFWFGVGTSAAQIEGAPYEGGRGPSILDHFNQDSPKNYSSKVDLGIDSYRLYKEDVKVLKDLGVNVYEFSISWSRILPDGSLSGGINQEGIDYYNRLIDEIVKNGITPFATLMHFDSPEALEEKYGGALSRSFVDDFKDYAEICFKTFGDRVKNWITMVELLLVSKYGYDVGFVPPKRCSDRKICAAGNSSTEPYIVGHNLLLAHATVVKLYRDKFNPEQQGQIGLTFMAQYYEPYSDSLNDKVAAKRMMDFEFGWFMEPLLHGDYPKIMRQIVKDRLPTFNAEEKKLVNGSFDFIGISYYTTRYSKSIPFNLSAPPINDPYADEFVNATVERNGVLIGPKADGTFFIYVYPKGLFKLLEYIKTHYQNPRIYITENGITQKPDDNIPLDVALKDPYRISFIKQHLYWMHQAIKEGANVKGYFYWSIFDYIDRYGLYYVDYKNNFTRIPKDSARWFKDFLKY